MSHINMFAYLFTVTMLFVAVGCAPHQCRHSYNPTSHKGNERIPTYCRVSVPSDCPRSWKSGVAKGQSADLPLIDAQFIACHERISQCGYVPLDSTTGAVAGGSGVIVGAGVDLGSKDGAYFKSIGISSTTLIDKLDPYFGLKRNDAACAVLERPLILTEREGNNLTDRVSTNVASSVEQRYNQNRGPNTMSFRSLPRGIRTAIVDVWFQFGLPGNYSTFWNFVVRNNWMGAVTELRNFYSDPREQLRENLVRRNDEADIIEAANATCSRSVDVVFLLDESGSVSSQDFKRSKSFVNSIISAFPDNNVGGEDGSRFGLSVFDGWYRSVF